ncbi:MAG: metal-dependent hydrolase [Verrucomicrobiota bacterium]|jgi:inner membrane protein|nr:metal-dependent hydrolase [Verrucomicrobiota bacterium]
MPSPLIHLAAGGMAACAAARSPWNGAEVWKVLVFCLVFTLAPDLDVLPGFWGVELSSVHNQASHSLVFGLVCCLGFAWLGKGWLNNWPFGRLFGLLAVVWGLHLLLDWMTWGRGVMLLWPFSMHRFSSPIPVFYGVRYSEGLFSSLHWITLGTEAAFLVLAWGLWRGWRTWKRRGSGEAMQGGRDE